MDGDTLFSEEGTTQGDPLAMPMYALATIPLIQRLQGDLNQVWYADDSAAIGKLPALREWWDKLTAIGPDFGYFVNPTKTWLVTKERCHADALSIFDSTGVNVTAGGRPYLGSAIGSRDFVETYVKGKVHDWLECLRVLSTFAKTQPHAAFSALTHGVSSKWTYLCRTTPDISHLLQPLDDCLRTHVLPALTGRPPPCDLECALFALPARHGGLGIDIPSERANLESQCSHLITAALQDCILTQDTTYGYDLYEKQMTAKASVRTDNRERSKKAMEDLVDRLPNCLCKAVELAREKGSSTWLTALPLSEHGFSLHKGAFHDAMALRYGWTPSQLPAQCACGKSFSVQHALSCATGGFPSIRHNEIRPPFSQKCAMMCA